MPDAVRRERTALGMFVLIAAMAVLSAPYWPVAWDAPGVDFYQFRGLAKCDRESGFRLGSPYTHRRAYQQCLETSAASSADEKLQAAVASRSEPDTTGTPLSYYIVGSLPGPYSTALIAWRVAQGASFAVAVLLLAWPLGSPATAIGLSLACTLAFDPLLLDIQVGNLNAFELLGVVACAEALRRLRDARFVALLLPPALVLLVLLKPTVGLAAALLGLNVLATVPGRLRFVAIAAAAVALVWFSLLPAALFGSLATWLQWWAEISASSSRLSYKISSGNYSGITWLATHYGLSVGSAVAGVAAVLVASLVVTLARSGLAASARAAREIASDPLCTASLGVIGLLSLSPLVWSHYQVLAVIPALWLCRSEWTRGAAPIACGWLALLLVADLPRRLSVVSRLPQALMDGFHAWSWIPLWIGLLLVLRERARAAAAQPAVATAPFITPS